AARVSAGGGIRRCRAGRDAYRARIGFARFDTAADFSAALPALFAAAATEPRPRTSLCPYSGDRKCAGPETQQTDFRHGFEQCRSRRQFARGAGLPRPADAAIGSRHGACDSAMGNQTLEYRAHSASAPIGRRAGTAVVPALRHLTTSITV